MSESKATLGLINELHKSRLVWFFDGEDGGSLGQSEVDGLGDPNPEWERDDWEHWAASRAVMASKGVQRDSIGFYWESETDARRALRLAKESLKHERPLPAWAQTAIAAGWKAPKGWRP